MTIPDGQCPRCRETRPRDGHFVHQHSSGKFCSGTESSPKLFSTELEAREDMHKQIARNIFEGLKTSPVIR